MKIIFFIMLWIVVIGFTQTTSPNILWIVAEDLSPDLESYGDPAAITPNLNTLASQSTQFNNAFTVTPVCSPARGALITGMYNTTINAHNHRSHVGAKSPYLTGYTLPQPVEMITHYFKQAGYTTLIHGKTDYSFNWNNEYDQGSWSYTNNWSALKNNQPFFAQIHFSETHHPWSGHPKVVDRSKINMPPIYPETAETLDYWGTYLDELNVLDGKIGTVLQNLNNDGLENNTIVFFFSDHGREHVRCKQWVYDGGIHIPLMVRWPGNISANLKSDDLISNIDISATSLSLAGITPPSYMQGQVFIGPNAANKRTHVIASRDRDDETFDRVRAVRTERFKYIRNFYPELPWTQYNYYIEHLVNGKTNYQMFGMMKDMYARGELTPAQATFFQPEKPKEELFDIISDPHETINLAERSEFLDTLNLMRSRLGDWIETKLPQIGWVDKGAVPEPGTRLYVINHESTNSQWINITTTVDDVNGGAVSVKVEYSLNGGGQWHKAYLSPIITAEYDKPLVNNQNEYQISDITTNKAGANTIRFKWDTQSPGNGSGVLDKIIHNNIKIRTTQKIGTVIRNPVSSTHGFVRNYPAVEEDSNSFSFDLSQVVPVKSQITNDLSSLKNLFFDSKENTLSFYVGNSKTYTIKIYDLIGNELHRYKGYLVKGDQVLKLDFKETDSWYSKLIFVKVNNDIHKILIP